jgi:hypothetical protein
MELFAGTAVASVSVQFAEPGAVTLEGAHVSVEVPPLALSVICAVAVTLPNAPVIAATLDVEIAPAVAVNVALVCPAGTITSVGTVSTAALDESVTATGVELADDIVTEQVELLPLVNVEGVQLIPDT